MNVKLTLITGGFILVEQTQLTLKWWKLRDGENIEFNHKTIPANDLWKKSYRKDEGGRYYFTMEIIEDRLIYHAEGGGRGGGFEQDIVGKK